MFSPPETDMRGEGTRRVRRANRIQQMQLSPNGESSRAARGDRATPMGKTGPKPRRIVSMNARHLNGHNYQATVRNAAKQGIDVFLLQSTGWRFTGAYSTESWASHEAQVRLAEHIGYCRPAGIHEQIISQDTGAEKELNESLGPPRLLQASQWELANRARHVRLNSDPEAAERLGETDHLAVNKLYCGELDVNTSIQGKSWRREPGTPGHGRPDTMRSFTPVLLMRLLEDISMNAVEKSSVKSWFVYDEQGKSYTPSVEHILLWMGLLETPVATAIFGAIQMLGH
ncbi:unnamed protein product, partial [Polarella glacialis]